MWIEDLTKALYFLNATNHKYTMLVSKIVNNVVYFTTGECINVQILVSAYNHYIKTGEIVKFF